ncbi:hypothetical protein GQ54DRAFT_160271 [Martensiomyces pterosporus]|nr:hypothetical protein GQ54DRAFT_160271 [Martensiomyces pterosporus]
MRTLPWLAKALPYTPDSAFLRKTKGMLLASAEEPCHLRMCASFQVIQMANLRILLLDFSRRAIGERRGKSTPRSTVDIYLLGCWPLFGCRFHGCQVHHKKDAATSCRNMRQRGIGRLNQIRSQTLFADMHHFSICHAPAMLLPWVMHKAHPCVSAIQ